MTRARSSKKTAPHRRIERKCGQTKQRNRNRNSNHHRNPVNRQQLSSSNQNVRKHSKQPRCHRQSAPPTFRFNLPADLIRKILTFVPIPDLSKNARFVNTHIRGLMITDNTWMCNTINAQITPPEAQNQENPFKKVILLVTKSPQYGRDLHRAACKMKRRGPIDDSLFFRCSAAVFSYENGNLITNDPSTWHLLTMSCTLGMEILTGKYLLVYLEKKGLDENEMTEDGRWSVRNDYLVYQQKFAKEGVRFIKENADSYFLEEVDDFDLESHTHQFEESTNDDDMKPEDRAYPPCAMCPSKSLSFVTVDPLAMMTSARDGKMARRIVRLFMDFKNGVPPETAEHCRLAVQYYFHAAVGFSDPEDIETLQLIISNLYNVEPLRTKTCSWILKNLTIQIKSENMNPPVKWVKTVHGYDKHLDVDEFVRQRIIFARAMIPFAISKIDPDLVPAPRIQQLIDFVESERNPMGECVALRDEVKCLILTFVRNLRKL